MTELPLFVKTYLHKFAASSRKIEHALTHTIRMAVVVPVLQEYENLQKLIASLLDNEEGNHNEILILFVVNNIEAADLKTKKDNANSLRLLNELVYNKSLTYKVLSPESHSRINFAYIDASSEGNELPVKEGGVGLARKIGMDSALTLFDYSKGNHNALVCLDADCTVSKNYLQRLFEKLIDEKIQAASIRFEHVIENELNENNAAIINYEVFLRYYVLGLSYAKSPYAFYTIGSSMVCSVEAYCNIGGMNKLKAAEDFYFLEKLSKSFIIEQINDVTVFPSSRGSHRVPFGTGQRVNRYLSNIQDEYVLYNPKSFEILQKWLKVFYYSNDNSASCFLSEAKNIHSALHKFLTDQNFEINWERICKNSKTEEQINKQKRIWFDGFKTLKLIHYLRDNGFPITSMFDAVDELFALMGVHSNICRTAKIPPIGEQIEYLKKLRAFKNQ